VKGGFFLDVVVSQSPAVFELLASEYEPLLIWRNAFFVLDFLLDIVDGVRTFDLESDGLPRQRFHEDLHVVVSSDFCLLSSF